MPNYESRRAGRDPRRTGGTTPEFGTLRAHDGDIVTDFAVIRRTLRILSDRYDPEELVEAVEPMEE